MREQGRAGAAKTVASLWMLSIGCVALAVLFFVVALAAHAGWFFFLTVLAVGGAVGFYLPARSRTDSAPR